MKLTDWQQDYAIEYWVKQFGIKQKDINGQPNFDDVLLLINTRRAQWAHMNKNERAHWGALWDWCYHGKHSLKKKHLDKLEQNIQNSTHRQTQAKIKRLKFQAARNKLKSGRTQASEKAGYDMTAKEPALDITSAPWE